MDLEAKGETVRADNPNIAPMSDSWLEPDDLWCDVCDESGYTDCDCDEDDDDQV